MFEPVYKAKQISLMVLDRLHDYLDLLRIELQLKEREIVARLISLVSAGICALLALVFIGIAVIVSCWDSAYRVLGAWLVAGFFVALTALCYFIGQRRQTGLTMFQLLREEVQRDIDMVKEKL